MHTSPAAASCLIIPFESNGSLHPGCSAFTHV